MIYTSKGYGIRNLWSRKPPFWAQEAQYWSQVKYPKIGCKKENELKKVGTLLFDFRLMHRSNIFPPNL